ELIRLAGGHADRPMRILVRASCHRRSLESIELALVAERRTLPRFEDHLQRFLEARLALGIGNTEGVVGARGAAATDAEVEATLAEGIHRRDLFGDPQWIAQRKDLHGRPHSDAPRASGDEARQRERRRLHGASRIEVDLAEPHAVESPGLCRVRQLERLAERLSLAR